jgi:L-ascorbate metabolism protein UlaG (beta-lactamase superfamily)
LRIKYYSVGCFLIEFDGVTFLSDPFWSHLSFNQITFGKTLTEPGLVDPYLPELKEVSAVFVCHSHYDHMLDLPYIAPHLKANAQVFGTKTLKNTLHANHLPLDFINVNDAVARPQSLGRRLTASDGRLRILPIHSGHPPQYLFFHLFQDRLKVPRQTPPQKVWDYQEGETLAFLIDILDEKKEQIVKRVYLQTSSTGFPSGSFPKEILKEHPVDVALLGIDCANIKAKGEPSIIDFLDPPIVIFAHWEDFFEPKKDPPREIIKVDLRELKKALPSTKERQYLFPYWDSEFFL